MKPAVILNQEQENNIKNRIKKKSPKIWVTFNFKTVLLYSFKNVIRWRTRTNR